MFLFQPLVCCDCYLIILTRPSWLEAVLKKNIERPWRSFESDFFGVFFARSNARLWVCLAGCWLGLNKHCRMICFESEHVLRAPKWFHTSDIDLNFNEFIRLPSPDFHLNPNRTLRHSICRIRKFLSVEFCFVHTFGFASLAFLSQFMILKFFNIAKTYFRLWITQ